MRSRLALRDRVPASAIRVSASRLSSMLAILPLRKVDKNGAPALGAPFV